MLKNCISNKQNDKRGKKRRKPINYKGLRYHMYKPYLDITQTILYGGRQENVRLKI